MNLQNRSTCSIANCQIPRACVCHSVHIYFFYIFEIFTICFKEAISKLFERLHFERRCYPVIVLPRVGHFLIIIVFYCNTSVGHCRCSLLLAWGGGGTSSWFTCSFECPVRFRRYLFVILMIWSSTNGILESSTNIFRNSSGTSEHSMIKATPSAKQIYELIILPLARDI